MYSRAGIVASLLFGSFAAADYDADSHGQHVLIGPSAEPTGSSTQPNIIFILTDDQDLHMDSLNYMPYLQEHLIHKGTSFKRHFCTTAICCPSRVSLWTGMLAHNTNVTDVNPPYGGYPKFLSQGLNENYLPLWLQEAGYNTYYTGKLFNAHNVENYNSPYAAGWNQSDFLLDPHTYDYLNATYQRNRDAPVSHEGQHTIDVLTAKSYGLLDDAVKQDKPFFLGIAPVAPHSNLHLKDGKGDLNNNTDVGLLEITPPIPAERHRHLFKDAQVPRTPNFNPDQPSGANWIRQREQLTQENVDFIDHFYRERLRALQSVDELVDGLFQKLAAYDLLDNTYIFYTTDNGFHLSQHRLQPGKECSFEEDINVPLIVRGPNVPQGEVSEIVTTHIDLAPTILGLAGAPLRSTFDGEAVPLTSEGLKDAETTRHEHVTVEFWGIAVFEGVKNFTDDILIVNNTYKAVRIISDSYNLLYTVWCTNEHELYDLTTDPYQMHNLLHEDEQAFAPTQLLGVPMGKVVDRLDSLLFVLKSCKGQTCVKPWHALHPQGNVGNLKDALSSKFDQFYIQQRRIEYDHCAMGYIVGSEGPQFEKDGYVYRQGIPWHEWV
ncbi:Arylsulphatase [Cryphonectria parasitica EP155]|uniref:Arylsulfatase n=1 Tax=Cryphonectria parasitica (strain ATCC 38755 / EP155) TaxID=660469 RepID=A0A9P4XVU3_CRYP1|nr:Arylsulphatase [Cryphonectria parasitica EP155]KAF3762219.1 Arylsulphatase [Cryphonectria parasitica EP155]